MILRTFFLRIFLLLSLFSGGAASAQEFLDPLVAFKPSLRALDGQTVEVRYEIAKGYYLYKDKFRIHAADPAQGLGPLQLPPGKEKDDDTFGRTEVYYKEVVFRLPVERNSSGQLDLTLDLQSQGCADAGICYPPQTQTLGVQLPDPATTPAAPPLEASSAGAGDESGQIAETLKNAGLWTSLALFFVAGLGLSLTPCIFPMIPILSGIIAGQGQRATKMRGFLLSLAYVLGMALTYAAVGIAAGLSGTLLSAALQNAWVLGSFALIFVALSLSMFGLYDLQLPVALQSKLAQESGQLKGGSMLGVFLMGALSSVIVGPCVAAPLAGALLYIGQTGDAAFGGIALFVMALGMGAPLIAVGIAGGSLLPKAGAWMDNVKKTFGVLLLATALWLVSPVISDFAAMLGWAMLFTISAIYLHAIDPLPVNAKGWQRFWKGIGLLMLLTGAALLIGALAGNRDPLQPLAGLRGSAIAAENRALPFEPVRSLAELEARLASTDRPVMLDFYADWCVSCKEMEKFTFSDPAVRAALAGFTLLKADVTANSDDDKALLARFKLFGPPGIIFFAAGGREITAQRVVGFQDVERFLATLRALN
ncbi:protein-disulfide reductase DsbD [Azonexus sp.]|uniref:protein-disulfide reductase DsbD n=1 Tax=Azonexus sp. TaxID=1872668 RepID=UPI0039E3C59A